MTTYIITMFKGNVIDCYSNTGRYNPKLLQKAINAIRNNTDETIPNLSPCEPEWAEVEGKQVVVYPWLLHD